MGGAVAKKMLGGGTYRPAVKILICYPQNIILLIDDGFGITPFPD
jgi:hypothetical protein